MSLDIFDSDEEKFSGQNVGGEGNDLSDDNFITDTDANVPEHQSEHTSSIPVHTIQINAVPGSSFPHSGLGVVIPPEVAAQIATGGFNLMLEPVTPAVEGEPSRFTIKAVPIVPANPVNNNDISASGSEQGSQDSGSDQETTSGRAKKKGLGSAHKGGTVRKYSLWTRISFTGDVRLRGMTVKEAKAKYQNPDRKRVAEWLKEYDQRLYSNLPSTYTREELKTM